MRVEASHTITVEIDGTTHTLGLDEVQRLYDLLGAVPGVCRHRDPSTRVIGPYRGFDDRQWWQQPVIAKANTPTPRTNDTQIWCSGIQS